MPPIHADGSLSDWLVPSSPRETLTKDGELIHGTWHDRRILRARVETIMIAQNDREGLTFTRELAPGETCDLVLKIPFVNLESPVELDQLRVLDFDTAAAAACGLLEARGPARGPDPDSRAPARRAAPLASDLRADQRSGHAGRSPSW